MKTIKTFIFCFAAAAIFSCDNDNDPTNNVCDTTYVSTLITTAFSTANSYDDLTMMDLETHEYTIQIKLMEKFAV